MKPSFRAQLVAVVLIGLMVRWPADLFAARGNIYSAKAIKALEALINESGQIGATTNSSGALVATSGVSLPNGTTGSPSLRFTSVANLGLYSDQSGLVLQGPGAEKWFFNGNNFSSPSAGVIGWAQSSTPWDTVDLALGREAAATLQLGVDVNGAAVAQTIKSHDGITGTDVAGSSLTIAGGRGTGAGDPGSVRVQTGSRLTTGTTAHTLADRELIVAGSSTLTAAGADSFVEIGIPQGSVTGAIIEYTIRADDGTDFQARTGAVMIVAANKAGTETCTIARLDGGATVDGTTDAHVETAAIADMTNTFTCVTGLTDVVRVAANAAATGIVETTLNITYTVRKNGGTGAITPIP